MSTQRIETLLVGLPKSIGNENTTDAKSRPWKSGIFKEAVDGEIWLGRTNLKGDGQADLKHHGGPDKAVLAYPAAHYALWRNELGLAELGNGGFGENFSVRGMTEHSVCIGDTYQVGEALLQVSQPRQPCWKPARRWGIKDLALRIQKTGRTGWYFRVLQEGYVQQGNAIKLVERPYPTWTVQRCNDIMHDKDADWEEVAALASCPLLSDSWVQTLRKRAEKGEYPDTSKRLKGPNDNQ